MDTVDVTGDAADADANGDAGAGVDGVDTLGADPDGDGYDGYDGSLTVSSDTRTRARALKAVTITSRAFCAVGYHGPLCAVCSPGYYLRLVHHTLCICGIFTCTHPLLLPMLPLQQAV